MTITLTEKDIKELDSFFQEMPTKYGLQLINFFNAKMQEQSAPTPLPPQETLTEE